MNFDMGCALRVRVLPSPFACEGAEARAEAEGVGIAPGKGELAALGGLGGVDAAESVFAEHFADAVRVVAQDKRAAVWREKRMVVEERLLVHSKRRGERGALALAQPHKPARNATARAAALAAEIGEVGDGNHDRIKRRRELFIIATIVHH